MKHEEPTQKSASAILAAAIDRISVVSPGCMMLTLADDPKRAASYLTGHIANIIGPMPDDLWRQMLRVAPLPCDEPGCDCHIFSAKVFNALNALRDDWKAMRDKNGGGSTPW